MPCEYKQHLSKPALKREVSFRLCSQSSRFHQASCYPSLQKKSGSAIWHACSV